MTAEVTPHHLLLTDDLAESYDPVFKVNPPLRTSTDIEALRAGLADGTIDCVATDHAPHAVEDKETEWGAALPGMLGLQTALSIVIETMLDRRSAGAASPTACRWRRRRSVGGPITASRSRSGRRPTWCWSTRTRRGR